MRPTPAHIPDERLAPMCEALGLEPPDRLCPAMRAMVQARQRAVDHPNPRVQRQAPMPRARVPLPVPAAVAVDRKRIAANDLD